MDEWGHHFRVTSPLGLAMQCQHHPGDHLHLARQMEEAVTKTQCTTARQAVASAIGLRMIEKDGVGPLGAEVMTMGLVTILPTSMVCLQVDILLI